MSKACSAKNICAHISDIDLHLSIIVVYILLGSCLSAGVDPSLQIDNRIQVSSQAVLPGSKHNKSRAANARDERFRSGNHTGVHTTWEFLKPCSLLLCCCWSVCVLRFAHRSRPCSFGKVQREEDANALQETICVSSVFCWGMHPARWDLWTHCTARAEFMYLGHTWPGCKRIMGCLNVFSSALERRMLTLCCVQWSKTMTKTFATGKKCAVWWMCPFFVTLKVSVLSILLPGRSSYELHNGCIIRFFYVSQTFHQLL